MRSDLARVPALDADALAELSFHSRLFLTLSAPTCRYTIYYFLGREASTATSDELITGIETIIAAVDDQPSSVSEHELRSLVVDRTIPYIVSLDAFDYDSRTQLIRYHHHPTLEEYAEHAAMQELSPNFLHQRPFSSTD